MANCPWHHEVGAVEIRFQAPMLLVTASARWRGDSTPSTLVPTHRSRRSARNWRRASRRTILPASIGSRARTSTPCPCCARCERVADGTWIDYDRFHALAASGEPFAVEDYKAPCPPWALLGAARRLVGHAHLQEEGER